MKLVPASEFSALVRGRIPILDVRAPIEFVAGAIPNSVNLPLLYDNERAEIGTIYKQQGSAAAIARGHQLVSGAVKEQRVAAWCDFVRAHPSAVTTCFRGGMRSQLVQEWLAAEGLFLPRIEGGYKAFRQFLLEALEEKANRPWIVLAGPTGAGKTRLLRELRHPALDLEALAKHRGSAFGALSEPQPAQADFENQLSARLFDEIPGEWFIEDESRMIGARTLPDAIAKRIKTSPVILVEEPIETRALAIQKEYANHPEALLACRAALLKISKKLGGAKTKELLFALERGQRTGDHLPWITDLLKTYYDPFYRRGLEKNSRSVRFRGSFSEVRQYLG